MSKKPESKSKTLVDAAELKFEGWEDVVMLMERLQTLQNAVGVAPDEKNNKPGAGLLREINEIKSKLSTFIAVEGLEGLRHGKLVFSDNWMEGRSTVDIGALKLELVQHGVDLTLLNQLIEKCTKKGDGYMRRQLTEIKD
jgi:hypothetical protein